MAGAMRRMGIYLGLVEDDDPRRLRPVRRPAVRPRRRRPPVRPVRRRPLRRATTPTATDDDSTPTTAGYAGEPEAAAGAARAGPDASPRSALAPPLGASGGGSAGAVRRARVSAARMGSGPVAPPPRSSPSASRSAAVVEPDPAPAPAPQPYRITTLHPRTYNEARTIGERFRDGMPVIMNLTEMDDADAKRLVDFAAGLSFGLRGSIERVTAKVFLLSPQNVDVTAEDKARIREGGFFNQS